MRQSSRRNRSPKQATESETAPSLTVRRLARRLSHAVYMAILSCCRGLKCLLIPSLLLGGLVWFWLFVGFVEEHREPRALDMPGKQKVMPPVPEFSILKHPNVPTSASVNYYWRDSSSEAHAGQWLAREWVPEEGSCLDKWAVVRSISFLWLIRFMLLKLFHSKREKRRNKIGCFFFP